MNHLGVRYAGEMQKAKKKNILITGITSKNVIVYLYTTKLKNFGTE